MKIKHDPDLYRRLNVPFPSHEDAAEAVNAFFALVEDARVTCGIADIAMAVQITAMVDGKEHISLGSLVLGCQSNHEAMYLWGAQKARSAYLDAVGVKR